MVSTIVDVIVVVVVSSTELVVFEGAAKLLELLELVTGLVELATGLAELATGELTAGAKRNAAAELAAAELAAAELAAAELAAAELTAELTAGLAELKELAEELSLKILVDTLELELNAGKLVVVLLTYDGSVVLAVVF